MSKKEIKEKIKLFFEDYRLICEKHNLQIIFLNDEQAHVFPRHCKYYEDDIDNMFEEIINNIDYDYEHGYYD